MNEKSGLYLPQTLSFTHTVEALQPCFAGNAGLDLHYELTTTGGATGLFFYIIPREE